MRLALHELSDGHRVVTHEFNKEIVKIGRDPHRCDLVFAQEKWLMVSRVHAELRVLGERILLTDLNSRQGTFLNGVRISGEREVFDGSHIQFGEAGPVVQVEREYSPASIKSLHSALPLPPQVEVTDPHETAEPRSARRSPAELVLESGVAAGGQTSFPLLAEITVLGRDSSADVQVEAVAQVVSRRHAEIRKQGGAFFISDLQSFNGTLVNGHRITEPTRLENGDTVQLSVGGPILRFTNPVTTSLEKKTSPGSTPAGNGTASHVKSNFAIQGTGSSLSLNQTIVVMPGVVQGAWAGSPERAKDQLLTQRRFNDKGRVSVGRAADSDIRLDAFLISNHHALFINTEQGVVVQDAGSTNGVYLNGSKVVGWKVVTGEDLVQIGPFILTADPKAGISVFDTRSQTRVEAFGITKVIRQAGNRELKLLDNISLSIEPNEFVGLLGPSGAGKSLLMNALNGMGMPTSGHVLLNNLDLYQHLHSLKQAIGHVPQDDIIHQQLTIYQTLYYVARLRLSRDLSRSEIDQTISEVLELTNLTERQDVRISRLSGGQRKRVSIAVELVTKPSILFLDEPTSGLDPATEEKMMKLFRQMAESGRTVVLTTHAMENVHLFDKVAVLLRGKLVFYGKPHEALDFVGAQNFIEIYSQLEQPLETELSKVEPPQKGASKQQQREYNEHKNQIAEAIAADWRRRFMESEVYRRNVPGDTNEGYQRQISAPAIRRPGILGSIRQWTTLVRRYSRVLLSDRLNLAILFSQAPIIAMLTYLAVDKTDPRDFVYFVLAIVPVWFGTSVAAREIVKERSIYRRERMVNLGILPYIGSKLFDLCVIVTLQCVLLLGFLKLFDLAGLMHVPSFFGGIFQLCVMILTGMVGIGLGLFVSSVVKTSEVATSIVPLLLIPQILFCGLVGVPNGVTRVISTVMPATWSFDEMKRLSTLDTLKPEGSYKQGPNQGRGIYKQLEETNEQNLAETREQIEEQRKQFEADFKDYEKKLNDYLALSRSNRGSTPPNAPSPPELKAAPTFPEIELVSDDLSKYVSFKHPWGNVFWNPLVLMMMFNILVVMTLIAMRVKDAKRF